MTKHSKTRPRLKKITIIVNFSRISSTNYKQARVRAAHRSGIAESYAQEWFTAQESRISTRGNGPSPRNRGFPRAGTVHRPGIANSHAREWSTAQESQNPTRGSAPPLRNGGFLRAGTVHRPRIANFHAR